VNVAFEFSTVLRCVFNVNWLKSNRNWHTHTHTPTLIQAQQSLSDSLYLSHCSISSVSTRERETKKYKWKETKTNVSRQKTNSAYCLWVNFALCSWWSKKDYWKTCSLLFEFDISIFVIFFMFFVLVSCTFCCALPATQILFLLLLFAWAFCFVSFGPGDVFDVVACAVAAWMNISAASNFLKQLSERASDTRQQQQQRSNTRQIDTYTHTLAACLLCLYTKRTCGLCTLCVCYVHI